MARISRGQVVEDLGEVAPTEAGEEWHPSHLIGLRVGEVQKRELERRDGSCNRTCRNCSNFWIVWVFISAIKGMFGHAPNGKVVVDRVASTSSVNIASEV